MSELVTTSITETVEEIFVTIISGDDTITATVNEPVETITVEISSDIGPRGASAFEVAVNNGFTGTQAEWLETLIGEGSQGEQGIQGEAGVQGPAGPQGLEGIVSSPTPPTNTDVLWLDESAVGTGPALVIAETANSVTIAIGSYFVASETDNSVTITL
jgi:hypothetical protein